jgi:hypothetical protein
VGGLLRAGRYRSIQRTCSSRSLLPQFVSVTGSIHHQPRHPRSAGKTAPTSIFTRLGMPRLRHTWCSSGGERRSTMGPGCVAAEGSMEVEEPTIVMVRKPRPFAVADQEPTLVDASPVSPMEEQTAITPPPVARRPAPSAPVWKNAPAKPPRPTPRPAPSVPRPRTSGPPPLPASVAARSAPRAPGLRSTSSPAA